MLIAFGFGIIIFCIVSFIGYFMTKDKVFVSKRFEKLLNEKEEIVIEKTKKRKGKNFKLLPNLRIIDKIENELATAGILMKSEEFLIIWIILIFIPSGLVIILSGSMITASALIAVGVVSPIIFINQSKKKRIEKFSVQLGDALITLGNCLHSGLSLLQGIESIAREMEDPIGKEFRRVCREINYGVTVEKALNNLTKRVRCDELDLVVSAIVIQREVGGNLSVILENVSETIKERLKVKEEIKVLTSTGRMSGMVVGLLPVAIGLILSLITPGYIASFFETQLGTYMLVAAAGLEAVGFFFIQKIVTVKY